MQSYQLDDIYINHLEDYPSSIEVEEDTPTGWSSACLDETISYYTECNFIKHSKIDSQLK